MTLMTGKIEKDIEVCSLHLQRKICFGETSLDNIFTWVDASYSVYHGINIHNGGVMSMGLVVTHCRLSKHNLNTNISTEVDLVGASDYLPYNILYVMFMHDQGYLIKSNNFSSTTKAP